MNDELMLVEPSEEYFAELAAYRNDFLENSDSMDGCGPLRRFDDMKAYLEDTMRYTKEETLPEGMAVGVVFAGLLTGSAPITAAGAFALTIGIAIQNFPEGAIISLPLHSEGQSKRRAFVMGTLSGVVEPVGALVTILCAKFLVPIVPYMLAFAAGAMIYVVVEELIPESAQGEHSDMGTMGFAVGFLIMMILDVALG